jgi:hypothetical protein
LLKFRHAARDFAEVCQREHAVRTFAVAETDAGCFANWNNPADVAAPQRAAPPADTRPTG